MALTSIMAARGDDGYPRQRGVDIVHYAFGLGLRDDTDWIVGRTEIEVQFTVAGLTVFSLDFAATANGWGMRVKAVTSGGEPVSFHHRAERLTLGPFLATVKGERRRYVVQYQGVARGGFRVGANRYGERTFVSANWPDKARQWLPVVDHPSDKATNEFVVDAPVHYHVVANGRLQSETELAGGRRRTHWKCSVPIPTWQSALAVARFAEHDEGQAAGVPLQVWAYPQDLGTVVAAVVEPARQSVEFFRGLVGAYPYEKVGLVQAAGIPGGMENASTIFLGENEALVRAPRLMAHEVAHQWFGNSVTEGDWGDIWLSEGFATYFTLMFTEAYVGRAAFLKELAASREAVRAIKATSPGLSIARVSRVSDRGFPSPLVYQKGAWVLHMLRGRIGDQAFRSGIRNYYQQFRDGNASTGDFQRVMEAASGATLDRFFRQWLEQGGFPHVVGGWRYEPSAHAVAIDLTQVQPGAPYELPLDVELTTGAEEGPAVTRLNFTERRQQFQVQAEREPRAVSLDPDFCVLMDKQFGKR
jgi:aminopeptidase N